MIQGRQPFLQLPAISSSREVYEATNGATGSGAKHVGLLSFDNYTQTLEIQDLVLAHVSALIDGLWPIFRADAPAAIGYNRRAGPELVQPVLAMSWFLVIKLGTNFRVWETLK